MLIKMSSVKDNILNIHMCEQAGIKNSFIFPEYITTITTPQPFEYKEKEANDNDNNNNFIFRNIKKFIKSLLNNNSNNTNTNKAQDITKPDEKIPVNKITRKELYDEENFLANLRKNTKVSNIDLNKDENKKNIKLYANYKKTITTDFDINLAKFNYINEKGELAYDYNNDDYKKHIEYIQKFSINRKREDKKGYYNYYDDITKNTKENIIGYKNYNLICNICLTKYTIEDDILVYIKECSHIYCKECIDKIINEYFNNNTIFKCLACKK